MKKVPFLVGPTAAGKTEISVIVGESLGAEIISADSRQIYCGMVIGTAQPTIEETARVPHHFINFLDPNQIFSAGEFSRLARARIAEIQNRGKLPMVVGGSGLYISALTDDFFTGPSADAQIRKRLKEIAEQEGVEALHQKLLEVDPISAQKIMPSDYRRIERALEIYQLTGQPISEVRKKKSNPPPYQPVMAGLEWHRDQLYQRINNRCQQMLNQGLIKEVKELVKGKDIQRKDLFFEFNALNSVGYVEFIHYLRGEIGMEEMRRLFQRNTRRFAKRQISWFSRDKRIHWIPMNELTSAEMAAEKVLDFYASSGIQ